MSSIFQIQIHDTIIHLSKIFWIHFSVILRSSGELGAATEFLWSVNKLLIFLLSTSNFINNVRKNVPIERLSKCLVLVDMSRNIHHTSPSLSGKAFPTKSCEFHEKEKGNNSCLRFSHWLQFVCLRLYSHLDLIF